jgi:hypothetical protein
MSARSAEHVVWSLFLRKDPKLLLADRKAMNILDCEGVLKGIASPLDPKTKPDAIGAVTEESLQATMDAEEVL